MTVRHRRAAPTFPWSPCHVCSCASPCCRCSPARLRADQAPDQGQARRSLALFKPRRRDAADRCRRFALRSGLAQSLGSRLGGGAQPLDPACGASLSGLSAPHRTQAFASGGPERRPPGGGGPACRLYAPGIRTRLSRVAAPAPGGGRRAAARQSHCRARARRTGSQSHFWWRHPPGHQPARRARCRNPRWRAAQGAHRRRRTPVRSSVQAGVAGVQRRRAESLRPHPFAA